MSFWRANAHPSERLILNVSESGGTRHPLHIPRQKSYLRSILNDSRAELIGMLLIGYCPKHINSVLAQWTGEDRQINVRENTHESDWNWFSATQSSVGQFSFLGTLLNFIV